MAKLELNQKEQGVVKGFVARGSFNNRTVYLKFSNTDNIRVGDFVTLDLATDNQNPKPKR